jgi:hypothetical protein
MAIPTLFDALCLSAALGLEVGEALAATALDALCLSLTTALDLSDALALAATAFRALRLASTLGTRHAMLTATALRLRPAAPLGDRTLAAATALRFGLTLAAAALRLGLRLAAALDLAVTVTGLVRLCRSRGADGHRRDTCCKDELPHRLSPIRSTGKRTCYAAVPPITGFGPFSRPSLSLTFQGLAG